MEEEEWAKSNFLFFIFEIIESYCVTKRILKFRRQGIKILIVSNVIYPLNLGCICVIIFFWWLNFQFIFYSFAAKG